LISFFNINTALFSRYILVGFHAFGSLKTKNQKKLQKRKIIGTNTSTGHFQGYKSNTVVVYILQPESSPLFMFQHVACAKTKTPSFLSSLFHCINALIHFSLEYIKVQICICMYILYSMAEEATTFQN